MRLPAGEGRLLRQLLTQAVKNLQAEIPPQLGGQDYKTESERIEKAWKDDVARHYAELSAFAEARSFRCTARPDAWCSPSLARRARR